jgi:hypothetical protein
MIFWILFFQIWGIFSGTIDRILFFAKKFATKEAAQYR